MKKKVFVFPHNQIALHIESKLDVAKDSPNYGVLFAVNRDRQPDNGWGELHNSRLETAVEMELTPELKQLLLEDLAFAYGQDSKKFIEKLEEFDLLPKKDSFDVLQTFERIEHKLDPTLAQNLREFIHSGKSQDECMAFIEGYEKGVKIMRKIFDEMYNKNQQ